VEDFICKKVRQPGKDSPERELVVELAAELVAGKESRHWGKLLSFPLHPGRSVNRILPRNVRQQKLVESRLCLGVSARPWTGGGRPQRAL